MPRKQRPAPAAKKPAKSTTPKPRRQRQPNPPVVNAVATSCPKCGSTERDRYYHTVERAIAGVEKATGKHYTHVVWRRTRCAHCGKVRIDRSYENRVPTNRRAA